MASQFDLTQFYEVIMRNSVFNLGIPDPHIYGLSLYFPLVDADSEFITSVFLRILL